MPIYFIQYIWESATVDYFTNILQCYTFFILLYYKLIIILNNIRYEASCNNLEISILFNLFAGGLERCGIVEFRPAFASSRYESTRPSAPKIPFHLSPFYLTHLYLLARSTYKSVPRGVHRPSEPQQLSPLGDSRCSYLNNIPNSLASFTRDSPAPHHGDRSTQRPFSGTYRFDSDRGRLYPICNYDEYARGKCH